MIAQCISIEKKAVHSLRLSFTPHQSLPSPCARRLCSTVSRPGFKIVYHQKKRSLPNALKDRICHFSTRSCEHHKIHAVQHDSTASRSDCMSFSGWIGILKCHCSHAATMHLTTLVLALLENYLRFLCKPVRHDETTWMRPKNHTRLTSRS